jgi:hypothetical protein
MLRGRSSTDALQEVRVLCFSAWRPDKRVVTSPLMYLGGRSRLPAGSPRRIACCRGGSIALRRVVVDDRLLRAMIVIRRTFTGSSQLTMCASSPSRNSRSRWRSPKAGVDARRPRASHHRLFAEVHQDRDVVRRRSRTFTSGRSRPKFSRRGCGDLQLALSMTCFQVVDGRDRHMSPPSGSAAGFRNVDQVSASGCLWRTASP